MLLSYIQRCSEMITFACLDRFLLRFVLDMSQFKKEVATKRHASAGSN